MATHARRSTRKRILNNTTKEAIFVQSIFPAPYRTAVFEHLSRAHQLFAQSKQVRHRFPVRCGDVEHPNWSPPSPGLRHFA